MYPLPWKETRLPGGEEDDYLLVEETESLAEFFLEGLLVHGVGHRVDQGTELVELQLAGSVSVEFTDQLAEGLQMIFFVFFLETRNCSVRCPPTCPPAFSLPHLLVEVLLHAVHDLADLGGHDVALLSAVEGIKELLVL